jgi:hypothetical protein
MRRYFTVSSIFLVWWVCEQTHYVEGRLEIDKKTKQVRIGLVLQLAVVGVSSIFVPMYV